MTEPYEDPTNNKPLVIDDDSRLKNEKEMSTKEAYFSNLSHWAAQSSELQMFYNFLNFSYVFYQSNRWMHQEVRVINEQPRTAEEPRNVQSEIELVRLVDGEQRMRIIQRWGGTEMLVAPFWKRVLAEGIDCFIICIVKILLALMIRYYGNLHKSFTNEKIFLSLFEVSLDFFNLPYDVLLVVLFTKLLICCYECMWITFNNGSTPGKFLMKLRVIHADTMVPLEQQREILHLQNVSFWALVYPAVTPNGLRTFCRIFTKNFIVTCFFPVCVILIFPRNNRTTYDILTRTFVAEMNTERLPTQPRRRAQ